MLIAEEVNFSFNGTPILENISCRCAAGEVIGIVGRSGAGKTTLLNLMSGYLPLESGRISVDGVEPTRAAKLQRIGYVFQSPTLIPWLSIKNNTALPLRIRKEIGIVSSLAQMWRRRRDEVQQRAVNGALERAHIEHAASKIPKELSGGMQTRAAIARAIVYQPSLILLDEPFNFLDDIVKESLYKDLQQVLAEIKAAAVLVTHNLSEAVLLCDRVYVLNQSPGSSANTILHCEVISFPKPRDLDLLGDSKFFSARKRIRESVE
jgi:NitT/TauT family transport system ATP-binding protein